MKIDWRYNTVTIPLSELQAYEPPRIIAEFEARLHEALQRERDKMDEQLFADVGGPLFAAYPAAWDADHPLPGPLDTSTGVVRPTFLSRHPYLA